MPVARMRVTKYLPDKLYGFCQNETGSEVFFHLACFQPGPELLPVRCSRCPGGSQCPVTATPPPPVLGEEVDVVYMEEVYGGKAPRASTVKRVVQPSWLVGIVESFDPVRRYGFVQGRDQVSYHLHQSEICDGRLPLANQQVTFFAGVREGRPRACHVRVCR